MISVHLQFANNCTTTYSASSPITNSVLSKAWCYSPCACTRNPKTVIFTMEWTEPHFSSSWQ